MNQISRASLELVNLESFGEIAEGFEPKIGDLAGGCRKSRRTGCDVNKMRGRVWLEPAKFGFVVQASGLLIYAKMLADSDNDPMDIE